jgi:hypothetical protein
VNAHEKTRLGGFFHVLAGARHAQNAVMAFALQVPTG